MQEEKIIKELEQIIIENIQEIPEIPLSFLLSGGIDSSLVLALIKKVYPKLQIHTFSLARSENYPDVVFSREVSEIFGTIHHEIILSDLEFEEYKKKYEKFKKYDFKGDVNVYILCSIAKKYSNVIVTGDGGDECFGGYWLHQYPLGHRETGKITCFEDIHPEVQKHLEQMVQLGFRNFHYKAKPATKDYDTVWEYFVEILLSRHLEPLLHTAKILDINVYTPLFSKNLVSFIRTLPYTERINRKIERDLASKYLPKSIIERESIGFDVALDKNIIINL